MLSRTPYGFKVRLHTLDFIDEIKISPYADEDIELILKKISDENMESRFDNIHEDLSEYRYKHNDVHKMLYDRATFQQTPPDIPNIPQNEFESNVYVDNSGYLCQKVRNKSFWCTAIGKLDPSLNQDCACVSTTNLILTLRNCGPNKRWHFT